MKHSCETQAQPYLTSGLHQTRFDTLIADGDGLYDPAQYNDRLLLGLKGTMPEAELHFIKQRMLRGNCAKTARGELRTQLPMGYVYDAAEQIVKDPDQQAQTVISMVFELFGRYGTIHAGLRALVRNEVKCHVES